VYIITCNDIINNQQQKQMMNKKCVGVDIPFGIVVESLAKQDVKLAMMIE